MPRLLSHGEYRTPPEPSNFCLSERTPLKDSQWLKVRTASNPLPLPYFATSSLPLAVCLAAQQESTAVIRKIEQPSLLEVLDRVLDKGIVVDAWIRFSLAGIDFLTVEARIVVASIETYLQYAREFRTIQLQSSLPQILESIPGKTIQIKTRTGSS